MLSTSFGWTITRIYYWFLFLLFNNPSLLFFFSFRSIDLIIYLSRLIYYHSPSYTNRSRNSSIVTMMVKIVLTIIRARRKRANIYYVYFALGIVICTLYTSSHLILKRTQEVITTPRPVLQR